MCGEKDKKNDDEICENDEIETPLQRISDPTMEEINDIMKMKAEVDAWAMKGVDESNPLRHD